MFACLITLMLCLLVTLILMLMLFFNISFALFEQYQRAVAKALVDRVPDDAISTIKTVSWSLGILILYVSHVLLFVSYVFF